EHVATKAEAFGARCFLAIARVEHRVAHACDVRDFDARADGAIAETLWRGRGELRTLTRIALGFRVRDVLRDDLHGRLLSRDGCPRDAEDAAERRHQACRSMSRAPAGRSVVAVSV